MFKIEDLKAALLQGKLDGPNKKFWDLVVLANFSAYDKKFNGQTDDKVGIDDLVAKAEPAQSQPPPPQSALTIDKITPDQWQKGIDAIEALKEAPETKNGLFKKEVLKKALDGGKLDGEFKKFWESVYKDFETYDKQFDGKTDQQVGLMDLLKPKTLPPKTDLPKTPLPGKLEPANLHLPEKPEPPPAPPPEENRVPTVSTSI